MAGESEALKIIKIILYEITFLDDEAPKHTKHILLSMIFLAICLVTGIPLLSFFIVQVMPVIVTQIFMAAYITYSVFMWVWKRV